ncbi:MAG: hypothetical protein OXC12_14100, partial [Spirochaetaceae bacterium]|nr:hypothetical protein [Spirochaetaceae bacterium]
MNRSRRWSHGARSGSDPEGARGAADAAPRGPRRELILATRGSDLALAQTRLVGEALAATHPGIGWRLLTITTRGDLSARAAGSPGGRGEAAPGPVTAGEGRLHRASGGPARATAATGPADFGGAATGGGASAGGVPAVAEGELAALARAAAGVFTSEVAAAVARGGAAAAAAPPQDLPLGDAPGRGPAGAPPPAARRAGAWRG